MQESADTAENSFHQCDVLYAAPQELQENSQMDVQPVVMPSVQDKK